MTKATGDICTKAADCKVAKSCCAKWTTKASAGTVSTLLACIPDATAALGAIKVNIDGTSTGQKSGDFDSGKCVSNVCDAFANAKCTGVAAGASTLAVSAAVAATA